VIFFEEWKLGMTVGMACETFCPCSGVSEVWVSGLECSGWPGHEANAEKIDKMKRRHVYQIAT
jgi:hypothetical protein